MFKPRSGEYISEIRSKEVKFPSGFYVFTNGEWKYCKPYIYLEKKDLVSKDEYEILDANGLELEGDDSWENIR